MKKIVLLLTLLFVMGCIQQADSMKKVYFLTQDNVTIAGNYWQGSNKGILLLHMLPSTKESWNEFAKALQKEGYSVLAIDLRGHGESIKQGNKTLNFMNFTDREHQASINDVEAAITYMKNNNISKINIVGASIGANLALEYQSQHPEIEKTVLLSAGTNYRGIETIPFAEELNNNQKLFLAAGTLDSNTAQMANQIAAAIKDKNIVNIYNASAHGTDLFAAEPDLMGDIIKWLKG